MTTSTKTIIRAALDADPTIDAAERQGIMRIIDNGANEMPERAYTYKEAAQLIGVTVRSVQSYVARGLLDGVSGGAKGKRCYRITGKSLSRFLSGQKAG